MLPDNISTALPGDSLEVNVTLVEKAPLNVGLRF